MNGINESQDYKCGDTTINEIKTKFLIIYWIKFTLTATHFDIWHCQCVKLQRNGKCMRCAFFFLLH